MRAVRSIVTVALLLAQMAAPAPAAAHRIDEYLQATLVSLQPGRMHATLRLIPGVLTAPAILTAIDTDRDGVLSPREQQAYAARVVQDLRLTVDGHALALSVTALHFPLPADMREGTGEITLDLYASLPPRGAGHTLVLENRHESASAVYLMNALVPDSTSMQIVAQRRDARQARYEIDYLSAPFGKPIVPPFTAPVDASAFSVLFALGLQHIAGGFDHLLFLLVLLLPAPLVARGQRWTGTASISHSLTRVLAIVTAFTVGHSLTLLLAAMGGVTLPAAPVEVLIALSVFVSALHAIRPIFPRREAWVAGGFGLVHGLAFAATLTRLGVGIWSRVTGVLAFNLGIESMQLVMVAAVLPALLLMRGSAAYAWVRVPVASIAALASLGWMSERIMGAQLGIDACFAAATRFATPAAVALLTVALVIRTRTGAGRARRAPS